jgi:hypothetical protein
MKAKLLKEAHGLPVGSILEVVSHNAGTVTIAIGTNPAIIAREDVVLEEDEDAGVHPELDPEPEDFTPPQGPSRTMRAKLEVASVTPSGDGEIIRFHGVSKNEPYPEDGLDENNSFAKWSPSVSLEINVQNPALKGKLKPGARFYADFTEAPDSAPREAAVPDEDPQEKLGLEEPNPEPETGPQEGEMPPQEILDGKDEEL